MADKLRWANRDPGQKFSMAMMLIFASAFLIGGFFLAAKLLLGGPEWLHRLNGAGMLIVDSVLIVRAVRWWRASNAG
ncbi:MAG: hypothetical protein RL299_331 [Pseudomonadota bacterium]|jgi:hypothetical protein